jgi:hypothetical protein
MVNKNEQQIAKLHERLIKDFIKQIATSIRDIKEPIAENKSMTPKNDGGSAPTVEKVSTPRQEEEGPDKINEIRSEVAATESAEMLNPDKQIELMEIVKQKSEQFELQVRRMQSMDDNTLETAAQKFKNELMDNVRKQLTEKKYVLTD